MPETRGIAAWHEMMKSGDSSLLDDLLADDVVFHSPVVHTPQEGKAITKLYLSAASEVLGSDTFEYVREIEDGLNVVLEFRNEIDGIAINGIDMIRFNEDGQIVDFKVMVRPLKAIQKVHQKMGEMLQQMAPK
jgi:hypothetical protein